MRPYTLGMEPVLHPYWVREFLFALGPSEMQLRMMEGLQATGKGGGAAGKWPTLSGKVLMSRQVPQHQYWYN